jgi:hypothetical protein
VFTGTRFFYITTVRWMLVEAGNLVSRKPQIKEYDLF